MPKRTVPSAPPGKRRIQSIEVGFRVIRALREADHPLALRDITKATGMPPSKVHLYLASFLREGLVAQDPDTGHYALGDFAVELGLSAIRQLNVVDVAKPEMLGLTERTGCATYLSLFTERGPAIVSKVDGQRQGAFAVRLGYVLPMTNSATGLVFLAFLPEARTKEALADGESVPARRLSAIRSSGHATTAGLINANFAAISAPIFDFTGEIAAAVTLLGPDKYLVDARLERSIDDVVASAGRTSAKLGARLGPKI